MNPGEQETWTAAECADFWGVEPSTWRAYVATNRAPEPLPGFDEQRRRLWSAQVVRDYPRPGQGQRSDLTAQRIGEMFAVAKGIAEACDRYDEWSKLDEQIMAGNPGAARSVVSAARRWAKRRRAHAEALTVIDELAAQIGDLGAAILPMRMREQVMLAEAHALASAAREKDPGRGTRTDLRKIEEN